MIISRSIAKSTREFLAGNLLEIFPFKINSLICIDLEKSSRIYPEFFCKNEFKGLKKYIDKL